MQIIDEADFKNPCSKRILEFEFTPCKEIEMINESVYHLR